MQLPGQLQQTENEAARAAVTSECSYQSTCHNSCSRALECTKGYRKVWGDSHVSFDTTHRRDVWVLRVRVNTRDIRQVPLVNQLCQKSGCVVCQLSARQVAGRVWWSVRYVRPFNCSLLPTPPPLAECEVAQLVCLRRERLHGLDRDRHLAGEGIFAIGQLQTIVSAVPLGAGTAGFPIRTQARSIILTSRLT